MPTIRQTMAPRVVTLIYKLTLSSPYPLMNPIWVNLT